MYKYGYKIKLPIEDLRKDLISFNELWKSKDMSWREQSGSIISKYKGTPINDGLLYFCPLNFFRSHVGDGIDKTIQFFNGAFLNKIRITNFAPGQKFGFHIDNDSPGEGYWVDEVPSHLTSQAALHFLLSPPKGDITEFAHDLGMNKYAPAENGKYKSHHDLWNDDNSLKVVDRFILDSNPAIVNTGAWHRVSSNFDCPRVIASLSFWPTITFDNVIWYCRKKGILMNEK